MNRQWTLLIFTALGCGNSAAPQDASTDATADAISDALIEATAEASAPCKTGLPGVDTTGVTCGTTTCMTAQVCCLDARNCATSCAQLDLAWVCDRSAQCGTNKTCCYGFGPDYSTCPALTEATAPTCETSASNCTEVLCQTDTDCASGQTCYAVTILAGEDGGRTFGICR